MCGFSGILGFGKLTNKQIIAAEEKASSAMSHRGPDYSSHWKDGEKEILLSHQRLAIQDLSAAGSQPMISESGRYMLAFNGEIYNHIQLRLQLERELLEKNAEQFSWRGGSDTETLLACIEFHGVMATVQKAVGMFAFALWDTKESKLFLCRDRFGEKPLYYKFNPYEQKASFVFASELKGLIPYLSEKPKIDRRSLRSFFRRNYIPAPFTIFENIQKLEPGKILEFSLSTKKIIKTTYWTPTKYMSNEVHSKNEKARSLDYYVDELDHLLKEVIRGQMISDVPLGAFLSGGIDSSLVCALMQSMTANKIHTFSIGFENPSFDESSFARAVAAELNTSHHQLIATPHDAQRIIPTLHRIYDEPFADSSQIPTIMVSQLAKADVTVSLSGDGADEIFGGYSRYFLSNKWWSKIEKIPFGIRCPIAKGLHGLPVSLWSNLERTLKQWHIMENLPMGLEYRIKKLANVLGARDASSLYQQFVTQWQDDILLSTSDNIHDFMGSFPNQGLNVIEEMMFMDILSYLPDNILTKVDRAGMSTSLETRMPFLDHRIIEFASRLPFEYKINNSKGKIILRELLKRYVDPSVIERPKMGFGIPMGDWLRGPLKDWASDLLSPQKISSQGILDPKKISNILNAHISGDQNYEYLIWPVLMFQSWYDDYLSS